MSRESEHDPSQVRATPTPPEVTVDADHAARVEAAERDLEAKRMAILKKFGAVAAEATLPEILEAGDTEVAETLSTESELLEKNDAVREAKPKADDDTPARATSENKKPVDEKPVSKLKQTSTPERRKPDMKVIDGAGKVREAFETTKLFRANTLPEGTISVGVTLDFEADDLAKLSPYVVKKVVEGGKVRGDMPDDLKAKVPALYDSSGMKIDEIVQTYNGWAEKKGRKPRPVFLHFDPETVRRAMADGLNPEEVIITPAAATVDSYAIIRQVWGGKKGVHHDTYAKYLGIKGLPVTDNAGWVDSETSDRQRERDRVQREAERAAWQAQKQRRRAGMNPTQILLDELLGDLFGPGIFGNRQEAAAPKEVELRPEDIEIRGIIEKETGGKHLGDLGYDERRKLFRKLSRELHPDAGGDTKVYAALTDLKRAVDEREEAAKRK